MHHLFAINSPEQELHFPQFQEKGVQVFVKRDDMIHPFVSGNKWRKLQYPVEDALRQGKNHIVTFGGAWSNHLLATAAACASLKIQCTGIVRGEEVNNPVLAMCRLFGMKLTFVDRTSYRDKYKLFEELFPNNDAYFVNEGGSGLLALKGCKHIVEELKQQYSHIFVAAGTGSTLAGITLAVDQLNLPTAVHGVPVLKSAGFLLNDIAQLGVNKDNLTLHLDYHFGGYAKTQPPLIEFIKEFVKSTGIMIEPTYTGKLFFAVSDLIAKDYFPQGSKILCIHTGGLTGFLGMYESF